MPFEFGGVGVAELVDVDLDTGLLAVAGPAVVGGVAGKVALHRWCFR
jgi:hypothetical protein